MEIEEIIEKYTYKQIEDMTRVEFCNLLGYIKIEKPLLHIWGFIHRFFDYYVCW